VLGGQLHGVEHAQDLVEVSARGHRVGQHQLDLLVGADDEDRAHGRVGRRGAALGAARLLGRQHVVELGHREVGVADHRIGGPMALRFLDVVGPAVMSVHRVDAQADQLGVALGELGLDLGHVAQLGGAHRREVLGVGEQDRPLVADPLVKVDVPLGGLGLEVGGLVVDAQ
jgi:hypothetical protein